jgi:transcriptional regulator with XRE-family HTH domain
MEATAVTGPAQVPGARRKFTLRELREVNGWSQNELSVRIGCAPMTVSQWELLKSRPAEFYVDRLEKVFKVSREYIVLKPSYRPKNAPNYGLATFKDL